MGHFGSMKTCAVCKVKLTEKTGHIWTGHIHSKNGDMTIAGWCDKHYNENRMPNPVSGCKYTNGCFGERGKINP